MANVTLSGYLASRNDHSYGFLTSPHVVTVQLRRLEDYLPILSLDILAPDGQS